MAPRACSCSETLIQCSEPVAEPTSSTLRTLRLKNRDEAFRMMLGMRRPCTWMSSATSSLGAPVAPVVSGVKPWFLSRLRSRPPIRRPVRMGEVPIK